MPYNNNAAGSDFEKLQLALREITHKFGSLDDILVAFGLADMPTAQRYGILFGFIVFTLTVGTVLVLLVLGGSFQRIAEQAETGAVTVLTAGETRAQRALLLEQLLESRQRMARRYETTTNTSSSSSSTTNTLASTTTDAWTPLTRMLLQEAPDHPLDVDESAAAVAVDENTTPTSTKNTSSKGGGSRDDNKNENTKAKVRYIPPFYQENYTDAYRKCQDKPGGEWDW